MNWQIGGPRGRGRTTVVEYKRKAKLLGLGLDGDDGHLRVTRGCNFHLVGGSHDTHQRMQETCIRFNEKLDDRGKQLEHLDKDEFYDLAAECKMNVVPPRGRAD